MPTPMQTEPNMGHEFPRTERDLRDLSADFSASRVTIRQLVDRLEGILWWARQVEAAYVAHGALPPREPPEKQAP